ncbi:ParA family protein [Microbacterium sp. 179-B 1A2 NHS]|uniref:ParA family protein n=1 Tax=Microbacterium sp. 179-B 1A2 NHS TaxID=3142383 RepID=UPI0039A29E22
MSTSSEPLRARAHVTGVSARYTSADGRTSDVAADDADGIRDLLIQHARTDAVASGAPLALHTSGDHGEHELLVDPDGRVTVTYDDRTLTRAELRQHLWWTTARQDAPDDAEGSGPVEAAGDDPDTERADAPDEGAPEDDVEDDASDDEDLEATHAAAAHAPVPAADPPGEDAEDDPSPEDEAPAFAPVSAGDPGDDDDLEDGVFAARTVITDGVPPAVPQFFLPGADGDASAAGPRASTGSTEHEPLPWTPGEVTEISADAPSPVDVARASRDAEEQAEAGSLTATGAFPVAAGAMASGLDDSVAAGVDAPAAGSRPTFIEPATDHPAQLTGWRAFLASLGLPVGPSRAEIERAEREKLVSRQWAGCRAIAVANGKGGVGKTMTTAVLSAVFARHGGGNVLAWDNNDTRGTLGWRTEQGEYDTTIRDLLPEARRLLEPTASVSDIARFVHHQSIDRYDVLRSNPELLAADQRITTADFDLLARVAARYYRMVIFDSGNDESADRWLRMIDSAHQLVVPTLAAPESAESAALLLDALRHRDEHSQRLADSAIVIVGQSEKSSAAAVEDIAAKFIGHVRAVQIIPFDHALKAGRIRYDALQPRTRDAWMRAAAAVAEGL